MKKHNAEAKDPLLLEETSDQEVPIDYSKWFYAPYHHQARKMFEVLKIKFNIHSVCKKITTLGNILFKRRPKKDI